MSPTTPTVKPSGIRLRQDDALLVAAAQSGNDEAFKLLVERHRCMVLFTAMRFTACPEDAEDVAQQSFQKAFVHLKQFEGRSSFSTWLIRITRNEALMLLRNRRRCREVSIGESNDGSLPVTEVPDSGPNPEDIYFERERQRILLSMMSELTPPTQTTLRFCDLDQRPLREAAHILDISMSAAKSRLSRGRKELGNKFRRFLREGCRSQLKGR